MISDVHDPETHLLIKAALDHLINILHAHGICEISATSHFEEIKYEISIQKEKEVIH